MLTRASPYPITKRAAQQLHHSVPDKLLQISNVHTSLCQASDCGMRGLQGTFPCCKTRLPSNSAPCHLVIEAIVLLHNFGMEFVGYSSQIKTVFDPEYAQIESLHDSYNHIAQYYFHLVGKYDSDEDEDSSKSK